MMRVRLLPFLIITCSSPASAFCTPRRHTTSRARAGSVALNLVTEDDVISLVEKAENLWAQVEKLRTEANNLSLKAESLGQEAETSTADAMNSLKGSISAEKIEMANNAQNLSIDLGSLLEQVERATQMADEIEVLADEALAASEAAFEQHLIDFPEDG
ncbi:hypothetical protein ACHAWU_010112 [Discostella pseudostelligera]|uniref:Uncharacterized protein n=1 Tax=Discostella pseudostelligera TaxID=259834 RepID=A0ABD3MCU3_9STRA